MKHQPVRQGQTTTLELRALLFSMCTINMHVCLCVLKYCKSRSKKIFFVVVFIVTGHEVCFFLRWDIYNFK